MKTGAKWFFVENSSSENEEECEDNEAKTTCSGKKTIEAVIPMKINVRISLIVCNDRDGSEEENDKYSKNVNFLIWLIVFQHHFLILFYSSDYGIPNFFKVAFIFEYLSSAKSFIA